MSRLIWGMALATAVGRLALDAPADAYVLPQLGGGQAGMTDAPMKHADVTLLGTTLAVTVDETVPAPLLRSLVEPEEFDPTMPWHVLTGTAHNFQYGWNPSGFWAPPAGAAVWVEQVSATPGLLAYHVAGPPPSTPYAPIFGAAGSSTRWKWSGQMTHNAYAVAAPTLPRYEAAYRVYLGDAATGEPWPQYAPAEVTFTWLADVPAADFDDSGAVDGGDFLLWQRDFGAGVGRAADATGDGVVDAADLAFWKDQYGANLRPAGMGPAASVPEPAAGGLLLAGLLATLRRAGRRRSRSVPPAAGRRRAQPRGASPSRGHPRGTAWALRNAPGVEFAHRLKAAANCDAD